MDRDLQRQEVSLDMRLKNSRTAHDEAAYRFNGTKKNSPSIHKKPFILIMINEKPSEIKTNSYSTKLTDLN